MNMVQATVLIDATTARPGEPKTKPTSSTPGQTEVGPGSLFVTPAGWRGSWTVHEPLRKMWVVHNLPAQKAD